MMVDYIVLMYVEIDQEREREVVSVSFHVKIEGRRIRPFRLPRHTITKRQKETYSPRDTANCHRHPPNLSPSKRVDFAIGAFSGIRVRESILWGAAELLAADSA